MRVLDDAVREEAYDVIVVGAGLGGLTAAALIAKRGLRVLLLEHHYLPGGMCTTLRRQGFSFDTGTALMYGFGPRGVNPHRFVINELEQPIDVIAHRALLRMHFEGRTITFWPDYDQFLDELARAFPDQEPQLRALFGYLRHIYTQVIARQPMIQPPSEMPGRDHLRAFLRNPRALVQTVRMLATSTATVLGRFITDPDLLAFFDKLTSTYCYCTIQETPAILATTMFIDNHIGGAYYPARSPQVYASTLEKALEAHGGQVLYRRRVTEILIEQGRATGVRLADGTTIRAERVVANVTVWNLYRQLIRPEHSSPRRRAWAERLVPTYPSMVLYLGVDAAAIPADTNPVEMLIADKRGVNQGDVTVYISSLDDPSICPPGTHALTVIAPSTISWPAPGTPAYQSAAYQEQKQRAAERILDQLTGRFPDLRRHIRVREVGTPSTIERYTLKNGGAVGGPKQAIGQEMLKRLHARSEWKNLYLCGDSTVMGMGTPAVTVSGVGAANCVLRDAGRPDYAIRTFERQYVHLVTGTPLPPLPGATEKVKTDNARRLARECEYCERPGCRAACPAGMDIGNVMRRVEAGNIIGAARACRETNPLAEVCGHTCAPEPPCERHCNRRGFAPNPVRIAQLHAWVCREAGNDGWSAFRSVLTGPPVAVVGAGPAGLTAAHFLARIGCAVTLYDSGPAPGGSLLGEPSASLPREAVAGDLRGLLGPIARFEPGRALGRDIHLAELLPAHRAVLLATGERSRPLVERELGGAGHLDAPPCAAVGPPGLFATGSLVRGAGRAVQAVADGRRAAQAIESFIASRDR